MTLEQIGEELNEIRYWESTSADPASGLTPHEQILCLFARAISEEREACAAVLDRMAEVETHEAKEDALREAARNVRARGETYT